MKSISKIKDYSNLIQGKTALVRVDFNLPSDDNGKITNYSRVFAILPTLEFLIECGCNIVLISHYKDPYINDDRDLLNSKFSFQNILDDLTEFLHREADLELLFDNSDINSIELRNRITSLNKENRGNEENKGKRQILLLENLRFYGGEKKNDEKFAKQLSELADFYVCDAFSCTHRAHASISKITDFLPSYAGLGLIKEVENLENIINSDDINFSKVKDGYNISGDNKCITMIIGGNKISTKLTLLIALSKYAKNLVIVGGLANSFLRSEGYIIGDSFYEDDQLDVVKNFVANLPSECKLVLPIDFIVCDKNTDLVKEVSLDNVEKYGIIADQGSSIFDIGEKSVNRIGDIIDNSDVVIWNGPCGMFEDSRFENGTLGLIKVIVRATKQRNVKSLVGGGDTLAAVEKFNSSDAGNSNNINSNNIINRRDFSHVSNGGGAFLAWLENPELPGLLALKNKNSL